MEAASARMAARDRFGTLGDAGPSPLQRYIQGACDPTNYEPNLALDLEIADLINAKKGNAPREAAVAIVNYINHRNANVSLLALTLLDICVKNCGYPFHLQISTKEFLNELVRRFPERPPVRPSRVQLKILEAIEEWRQTICQTSRYKEDLGFIRDMHRLLSYKGYTFPEVRSEDAAVLNPSDNLKSAEEMEEEERAAHAAKLQELIRRGGPEDLQEANKLMKVMAGYDTKHKTDYRAKAAEEVGKIQQKAKILEEMLQGYKEGDMMAEGDVFQELANSLQNAQPKIQRMCEEESDDQEAVAKLFEINDSIHRTLERYKLVKKGDLDGAAKIPKGTLGTTTGVSKSADNELSLIDFGADNEPAAGQSSATTATNAGAPSANGGIKTDSLEDDLLGLSFQDATYGQGGGIALGLGTNSPFSSPSQSASSAPRPPPGGQARSQIAQTPPTSTPNYSAFSSLSSTSPAALPTSPPPPSLLQQRQAQQSQSQPPPAADPFASIISAPVSQPSPFAGQQQGPRPTSQQANGTQADSEEWTFASSLPQLPSEITVLNSVVQIQMAVSRAPGPSGDLVLVAKFSNNGDQAISEFAFQLAVTKGFRLRLNPQSGLTLAPRQRDGITQVISLEGVEPGKVRTVKMRWKASYKVANAGGGPPGARMEQGEISDLGVA